MDDKDRKILELLKEDSSLTTRKIAKQTHIPITTVHKRIQKLKASNIIKRYTIELDYDQLGKSLGAYILIQADLKLLKQKHKTQIDIINELKKIDQVEKTDIVVGGSDIVAFLRAKDIKELDQALLGKIHDIDGIVDTQTMIVIH
ncbi:MAG: Lrp/AsnC family transcriptional regulator [Candidatus Woesearchaeota archaeon]|jgi:DNA-binding Lrp family transcriptional regulator|nr:Lrp/AsnC family transcriptional regulator [Candidatus Woesearchaeota archaeon]